MMPYIESAVSDAVVIRTFYANVDESELTWHWDEEDRWIQPLNVNDWEFQFDDNLPFRMEKTFFVHRGVIHRVIRGTTSLIIKIIKTHENQTNI